MHLHTSPPEHPEVTPRYHAWPVTVLPSGEWNRLCTDIDAFISERPDIKVTRRMFIYETIRARSSDQARSYAGTSRCVGRVISVVSDCVCVCSLALRPIGYVRALQEKHVELSKFKSRTWHTIYSTAGPRNALNLRSKGQGLMVIWICTSI